MTLAPSNHPADMTAFVTQEAGWLVFRTKPFCFVVYRKCGFAPVPEWEMRQFLVEEIGKVRDWLGVGGAARPAW